MIDDIVPPKGGRGKIQTEIPSQNKQAVIADEPLRTRDDSMELAPFTAADSEPDTVAIETDRADASSEPLTEPRKDRRYWPLNRKWTIISAAAIVLLVPAGILAFNANRGGGESTVVASKQAKPVKITTVASTLTGLQVDKSANDRPVVAAMIENSPDARPQSGLDQAGIVYEAMAEGGITRFMAVFQDTQPTYIGPVRSARPYYVQWALGYDAAYAHVGGSPEALQDIKDWNVRDLNQFYNGGAFSRISSRAAPHNVYTSIAGLTQLAQSKGYSSSKYTGFVRKPEAKAKTPTASAIDFRFSGPAYNPHFDYNPATNSYNRSQSGAPYMVVDADGAQKQLSPKVVLGLVVSRGQNGIYSGYKPVGSGQVYVFQDGTLTMGSWSKASNEAPLTLSDAAGKPFQLDPGQTWISAVPTAESVSYK